MRRALYALALLALTSCSARLVIAGRDDTPAVADASPPDGSMLDAAPPAPIDAAQALATSTPDAASVEPAHDAGAMPVHCASMRADCDQDPSNGCEVDLAVDALHCGNCQDACQYPDCACRNGTLTVVCPAGHADCDGDQ